MSRLSVVNFITLNGYFEGPGRDISWHPHDTEGSDFSMEGLNTGNTLLFGRVTYEIMTAFWPTSVAMDMLPAMAEAMNLANKVVFSRTLEKATWNNTRLVRNNMITEIKAMKLRDEKDMTILGSGSIITQCADHGLIDEYQIMIDPVAIGNGTPMLKGIKHKLNLKLNTVRTFVSGAVLLTYRRAAV